MDSKLVKMVAAAITDAELREISEIIATEQENRASDSPERSQRKQEARGKRQATA